jgi:molybdopterin/thiamine biosynthesis adenylyltransferase
VDRYSRHTVLPWFGASGQKRLQESSVLVIGCGGTGCCCSSFLARAGLGKLLIADPDIVSLTDLARQTLYREADVDEFRPKVNAARDSLAAANSETDIEVIPSEFSPENAASLTSRVDLIVDCSDNFGTRMLINDVCLKYSLPWVHGACTGTAGIVIPFSTVAAGCYRCVVGHIPGGGASSCVRAGILGPVAGFVGCIEAAEAIKMLIDPQYVHSKMIYFDSLSCTYETIDIRRREDCPACVRGDYEFLEGIPARREFMDCETATAHLALRAPSDLKEIRRRLSVRHEAEDVGGALRVVTPEAEFMLLADGTAIVRGAQDLGQARSLLDRLLES